MTARPPLLLAASLVDRRPTPDHADLERRARVAERAGLDLVVVEDGPLDPLLVAARLAARTATVGVAPVVATTATEPFHVSTALATIDVVARGRAGWVLAVPPPEDVRGTVTWEVPDDVHGDAAEHVDAVRALWDSWEDGAVIRDAATDRFLDRDRVHHVDLEGRFLAVRGPSITPRPPQGHPPVLVRVTGVATLELALRHADALLTTDPTIARGGGRDGASPGSGDRPGAREAPTRGPAADASAADDRPAGPVRILELQVDPADLHGLVARIVDEHAAGVAGVLLHAEDLDAALAVVVPGLVAAGVRPASVPVPEPEPTGEHPPATPPTTLRARLGLPAAANRFGAAR